MTTKIISIISLIGCIVLGFLHYNSSNSSKIAYINTPKLINEYEGMKAARAEFQQKSKTWQANVDTLSSEMEQAIKTFEKDRVGMTEKEMQLSQQLLQNKRQQLMQYQQAMQQKAQEEESRLNETVMAQINAYLKTYGEDSGYEVILGATTVGNIIYAKDYLDITGEAIKGLNESYGASNE